MTSSSTPEDSQDESIQLSLPKVAFADYRREISASRKVLRRISSSTRIRNCQRYSNGNTSDQTVTLSASGEIISSNFSKLSVCGRSSCPNCGQMHGMRAERQVEALIRNTQAEGGRAQLIVATSRSAARLDHEELIKVQGKAYSKFLSKLNQAEKTRLSIAGVIHMPEISYTESGINPHSNIVILYSARVPAITMKKVEDIFARCWIDTHVAEKLPRPTRKNGISAQEIFDPNVVSGYLTKSYKHGFPRSLFNNGWFKENGDLDDDGNGNVRNPHDILRLINANPKLSKFFIPLAKNQEIVRLGNLEFGIQDKKTGEVEEIEKLPKVIRHWLDYETALKNKTMVSFTKAPSGSTRQNESFWERVTEIARESLKKPVDDNRIVITIPHDLQKWVEARSSVDELMMFLNTAALAIKPSESTEESIRTALKDAMDSWVSNHANGVTAQPVAA
jgi:hypothetical protein